MLSEKVLGCLAEMVSHRWNKLFRQSHQNHTNVVKGKVELFLYMSSCKHWEVSVDFFQRLCELCFGIYKATRLMPVFM